MLEHVFLGVGFMALTVTIMSTLSFFDKTSKLVWGLMGVVLWGVWALQASSVETITDGGSVVAREYNSLLVVGGLFAALMVLSTVLRIFELYKE